MATESSEGEEEGKLTGGNQVLTVDDDLREMGKKAAWSVSSCKAGNGVSSLRDDNLDTYWQSLLQFSFPFLIPQKYENAK
ncbi:anaphase-promoting complex subunit 10 [Prunus yedoensis var. nudiflora]|uniref:Anaphase-promoting complex subunit 10 n=1 Tax=Prunus yedoensis var. nudiflora TaxID=2094558 RepID=A0A314XR83_PRUYE|nr:anaphase-promoting complex subunit 10 [Prunus yedoensis var. nudiflora]